MNRLITLLFYCFICNLSTAIAQREHNVWCFGNRAGINFNLNPPQSIATDIFTNEGCATICDNDGQLLFYTDGTSVWNKNNNLMPNGADLINIWFNYTNITFSTTQAATIVPVPGTDSLYYIFSLTQQEWFGNGKLFYSIVDMSLDNGLGDIIPSAKKIFLDSSYTERMIAVRGNNCDIWVVLQTLEGKFHAYNITSSVVNPTPVVSPGLPFFNTASNLYYKIGCMDVSPQRDRIALNIMRENGLLLYDFDPGTGLLSNPMVLDTFLYGYGVAFSPDGTKLYANWIDTANSAVSGPFQYDLSINSIAAIKASKYNIAGSWNDLNLLGALRRAPDGKIYCGKYSVKMFGVINQPNLPGTLCQYNPYGFQITGTGNTILGLPDMFDFIIPADSVQSYNVCSAADPVRLSATHFNGRDYIWNDNLMTNTRLINGTGTYWVKYYYQPPGCTLWTEQTDTFHVVISAIPPFVASRASCKGKDNGLAWHDIPAGDTNTYIYKWSMENNNPVLSTTDTLRNAQPGSYMVHITNLYGCDTILRFTIQEQDYKLSFVMDSFICAGDTMHFINSSDNSFINFLWSLGDGTTTTEKEPIHIYNTSGDYLITLTGIGDICKDSVKRILTVDAPVDSLRFVTSKERACIGDAIQFWPDVLSSTLVNYHWQFGEGSIHNTTETIAIHTYDTAGTVIVSLTAYFRACPELTAKDTIMVSPYPLVNLGPDTSVCTGQTRIVLENLVQQSASNLWSTGATTDRLNVAIPGVYWLAASNESGCVTTDTIEVSNGCYIAIPNAFTPNGDGINDYFFPRDLLSAGLRSFSIGIYNRWGQIIFENNNINGRGWDGTLNGTQQPEGVYVYLIKASFANGTQAQYRGSITLIR